MNIRRAAISDANTLSRLSLDVQRLHARALPDFFNLDARAFFQQVGFETTTIRMWHQVTTP